jgi:hypothetical protein
MKKRLFRLAARPASTGGPASSRWGILPLGVAFTSLALVSGLIGAAPASARPAMRSMSGPTVTRTANATLKGNSSAGPLTANGVFETTYPSTVSPGDSVTPLLNGTLSISSTNLNAILKQKRATSCTFSFTVFDVTVLGAVPSPQNINLAPFSVTSPYPPLNFALPSLPIGPLTAGPSGQITITLGQIVGTLTCQNAAGATVFSSSVSFTPHRVVLAVIRIIKPGSLGTVGVQVSTSGGSPVAGAGVTLCDGTTGNCYGAVSDGSGAVSISNLPPDQYYAVAFPAANSGLLTGTGGPAGLPAGGFLQIIVVLHPPAPVPSNVTLGNNTGNPERSVPVEYWKNSFPVSVTGCAGGTATWSVTGINSQTGLPLTVSGPMTEAPPGVYSATIPPLYPIHGPVTITLVIHCPDGTTQTSSFNIYIDPSGTVVNQKGRAISGATVTLSNGPSMIGPFTPVANGDTSVMSPANANNPQLTGTSGRYGWDVVTGYYTVTASAPNCNTVTSPALSIPPPVTGLTLTLTCH